MRFTKILALLLAVVMCFGIFAACGSEEEEVPANDNADANETAKTKVIEIDLTTENYAFGVDKDQPELLEKVNAFIAQIMGDGTFEEICDRYFADGEPVLVESMPLDESKDQLVVATNAAFEPFEYTKGDKYLGIDMEIAKLLADYLGWELVIQHMDFDAVCLSVGQHKCDIAMAGLTINEERKEMVAFSDSYYAASQKLVVPGDCTVFDECKTADDVLAILNELDDTTKIGFQNGTTGQFYVEGDEDWGFDGLAVTPVGYKNGSLAIQDMINGNVDYVIIDAAPAECITEAINAVA